MYSPACYNKTKAVYEEAWVNMKKVFIGFIFCCIILWNGCGKEEQNIPTREEVPQYYYGMTEWIVDAPERALEVPEGGNAESFEPVLIGERIFCNTSVTDNQYNSLDFYTQIWDRDDLQWTNISMLYNRFTLDDKEYDGFDSCIYASTNGEMYTSAYILEQEKYLVRMGEDSIAEVICEIPQETAQEWNNQSGAGMLTRDNEGNFYYFSEWGNSIFCYDSALQKKKTVIVPKFVYGIIQGKDTSEIYWYGCDTDNQPVIGSITDEKAVLEDVEGIATEYCAEISEEGILFLADTQNVWRVEGDKPQKVFNFSENGYIIRELYGMEATEDGEILFLVKMDGYLTLLSMKEIEKPQKKQEIVIAFTMKHWGLQQSIARFNRQSAEYHIGVMLPEEGETTNAYLERIRMELSAGRGPDIFGHDMVTNLSAFVENDYLECMDDVFADTSLYLQAALESAKIEGKMYGVPYDCSFDVVAYAQRDEGEKTSYTLEELMAAVEASKAEALEEGLDGVSLVLKYALYDNENAAFIDWEKGESHLTEAPFVELLSFAEEYSGKGKQESVAYAKHLGMSFYQLRQIKEYFSYFDGEAVLLGYPGQAKNGIYVNVRELYLNANSTNKSGAKEFLKFLVSEEEQKRYAIYDIGDELRYGQELSVSGYTIQFPVSLEAFDALVEHELEKDKGNIIYTDSGVIQLGELYTDEMIEQFYFMLNNARADDFHVAAISNIFYEELTPYYEGGVTVQEAVEKLNNRVQLYLDEQYN